MIIEQEAESRAERLVRGGAWMRYSTLRDEHQDTRYRRLSIGGVCLDDDLAIFQQFDDCDWWLVTPAAEVRLSPASFPHDLGDHPQEVLNSVARRLLAVAVKQSDY